jgi:hypothetical protein
MTFQVGGSGDNQNNGEYFVDDVTVTTADEDSSSVVSGKIYDLEPPPPPPADPQLSIDDASVTEGDSGTSEAIFTLSMDKTTDQAVTVDFATSDDSATAPSDYATTTGTATITAGETETTVSVPVNGDTTVEPDETFTTALSNAQNADIGDASGTGTIANDDTPPPPPSVSISDASVAEANDGVADESFTVSLDRPGEEPVSVDYTTSDGTATAPDDYGSTTGTATIPAGQTETTVSVQVNGDWVREPRETFTTVLSNAQNATIGDDSGTGAITNDDTNVDIAASNAVDNRVRATVSTGPQADGEPVRVYRQVAGDDTLQFEGVLNDRGRVSEVLDRGFRRGVTIRLYAQVDTANGTYQSETASVTID